MSRCTVLVGLIGAGKTTLAESMPCARLDFDEVWHADLQVAGHPVEKGVAAFADMVNAIRGDVVIDGWWTWTHDWFEAPEDHTLVELQRAVDHEVRVVYLAQTWAQAFAAYQRKRETGIYAPVNEESFAPLDDPDAYAKSLSARIACMERLVSEWAR